MLTAGEIKNLLKDLKGASDDETKDIQKKIIKGLPEWAKDMISSDDEKRDQKLDAVCEQMLTKHPMKMLKKMKKKEKKIDPVFAFIMMRGLNNKVNSKDIEEDDMLDIKKIIEYILKDDVKELVKGAKIPESLAYDLKACIPDKDYIPQHQVGKFTNILARKLYNFASIEDNEIECIDLPKLFKEIFGKKNSEEAAMWILLDKKQSFHNLKTEKEKDMYGFITSFALRKLNDADNERRKHLLELMAKRIKKNYPTNVPLLRVRFSDLNETHPDLYATFKKVSSYEANKNVLI